MRTALVFAVALAAAAPAAHAEDSAQRLGFQPMLGYVSVASDSFLGDCHDSFFRGGQSIGMRLVMGITRWFSIAFTVQPAFWNIRRGHFVNTLSDPPEIRVCGDLGSDPRGATLTGYERVVITSLSQKATFRVQDNANLYLLLGEGIYHRQIGLDWKEQGKQMSETLSDRYTGLAIAFGMDLHVSRRLSLYFELSGHLLSDRVGAGAVLLSPHAGLTYWMNLGREELRRRG